MTRPYQLPVTTWVLSAVLAAAPLMGAAADDGRRSATTAGTFIFLPPAVPPAALAQDTQPKPLPKVVPPREIKPVPAPPPAVTPPTPIPVEQPAKKVTVGKPIFVPAVRLYRCVKYKDIDEIAPDAIPLVIRVPHPNSIPSRWAAFAPPQLIGFGGGCAYPIYRPGCAYPPFAGGRAFAMPPRWVSIKICAPRSAVECLRVGRHVWTNRRLRYDFGDYRVDIRLRSNGWIEVDYQED